MSKRKYISIIVCILFPFISMASSVNISGVAEEYKNETISFYTTKDLVTNTEVKIAEVKIDSTGNFNFNFDPIYTREIYSYLGVYKALMFVEPETNYEIVLPPRINKTLAEELNPIFEPELISIGVKNSNETELNYLIYNFNQLYEDYVSQSFTWLYISNNINNADSAIHTIDSLIPYSRNEYFNVYRQYKYAMLRHFTYERDRNYATRKYLLNKPFHETNVAYMDFVRQLWNNYLTVITNESEVLYEAVVYGKSPTMVKQFFEHNIAMRNDTLKELVLLFGLDEAFAFTEDFPHQTLNQTLDSIIKTTNYPNHKLLAHNIKEKYNIIRAGDVAPDFELIDVNYDNHSLVSFPNKYIYLNFCRSENFACLKDYRLLQNIYEKYKDELEIITISYDRDFQTFTEFVKKNIQYEWTFLYGNNDKDFLKKYNVRIMPSYILIDPSGKISVMPAPSPHENIDMYFEQILNWRKRVLELEEQKRDGGYFNQTIPNNN